MSTLSDNSSDASSSDPITPGWQHIYHDNRFSDGPSPLYFFEDIAHIGVESQHTPRWGYHRFAYPQALRAAQLGPFKEAMLRAIKPFLPSECLRLPKIDIVWEGERRYFEIYLDPGSSKELWNPTRLEVNVRDRNKIVKYVLHSAVRGADVIPRHFVRFDIPDCASSLSFYEDKGSALSIVKCLNQRLVGGLVVDAWMDFSQNCEEDVEITTTWNGTISCLVALYKDQGCSSPTLSPLKSLQRQFGFLAVEGQDLQLVYPHRRFWCTNCKGRVESFHSIRQCLKRPCNQSEQVVIHCVPTAAV